MKYLESSAALLQYKDLILLMLRDDKPDIVDPSTWCFPGGGVEEGETFEESLKRELKEELNIDINIKKALLLTRLTYGKKRKAIYAYDIVDDDLKNIILGEGRAFGFFTKEDILELPLSEATQLFFDIVNRVV